MEKDIIELMETPINQIQFETQELTIRTTNALRRTYRNFNVCNLIYLGSDGLKRIKNLGKKCYKTLKNKLLTYGIDIEDKYQCNYLIKQYIEKQQKEIKSVSILLNTRLQGEYSAFACDTLKTNGYETFYDIILEDKDIIREILKKKGLDYRDSYYTELTLLLIKHGIDINDENQCTKLIEQYESEKSKKQKIKKQELKEIVASEESQQLEILTEQNDTLEKYLLKKQEILEELKKQVIKREILEQELATCDEEYKRLIQQYNSLGAKERGNVYGRK